MNILLLAPHPFYQDRGTPIAVNLLLRALSERQDQVTVLTFHEGTDVVYPNVTISRIRAVPFVRNIRPGFSIKKAICDVFLLVRAIAACRKTKFDVVHAVEESAFIAMVLNRLFHLPYVYDMDSSLPQQLVESRPFLRPILPILRWFEGRAVSRALGVVAVCDALAETARPYGPRKVAVLRDISLLDPRGFRADAPTQPELNIHEITFMYIGNLEPYQGIDLLLESFARLLAGTNRARLIVVGAGSARRTSACQALVRRLGIEKKVFFLGPKPVDLLGSLLADADVVVSPRTQGRNTPMKVYSYLDSGKPLLATDLPTHTQVLTPEVALLAPPEPQAFADAMRRLVDDADLRRELGRRGRQLAEQKYSFEVFRKTVHEFYEWVDCELRVGGG